MATGQVYYKGQKVYNNGVEAEGESGTQYVVPNCSDGIQNGDETGVDCGGSCPPCSSLPVVDLTLVTGTAYEFDLSAGRIDFCFGSANSTGSDIDILYAISGNGTGGVNFASLSGFITIADGQQCASLFITPLNDANAIGENVTITIGSDPAYAIGTNDEETVNIVDDDAVVTTCSPDPSPTDVDNITELLALAPGTTFNLTSSIDLTGESIPANLIFTNAGGGLFSGTNIDLNGMCVADDYTQKFLPSTTFANVNEESRVSFQALGAIGNGIVADDIPINTLINYFRYGRGEASSVYVKNSPSSYTRTGEIDIDWNGSEMRTTSTANFNMNQVTTDYVMEFTNLNVIFSNGNFSGGDVYGRAFRFNGQNKIHFINNELYDWYSPVTIRCVVFYMDFDGFDTVGGGVQDILFDGNTVRDIEAQGDGDYNNSPGGISKGWWYSIGGGSMSDTSTFSIVHRNNIVHDIIGDDAEGLYIIGGTSAVNPNGTWLLDNEHYWNCTRRAIKVVCSNVTVRNSTFEEMDDVLFVNSAQVGSMVDFFRQNSAVRNIRVHDNIIKTRDGAVAHYWLLSFTEAQDVKVYNNTITMPYTGNYGGLRLGSNTGAYAGYLEDIEVYNNTFNDAVVQLMSQYAPVGQLDIHDNDFNIDATFWNSPQGIIRTVNTSGTKGNIDFTDNDINVNFSSSQPNFHGMIYSAGADLTNINILRGTLNYQNASVTNSIGWAQGDFGSSNSINSLTISGDTTPTMNIDGTGNPTTSGNSHTIIYN